MRHKVSIALLHYTSLPAVGGIENMLSLQQSALEKAGFAVRLITGTASTAGKGDVRVVPALVPGGDAGGCSALDASEGIYSALLPLLRGVDQCWVHNAFTVSLHAPLSSALLRLVDSLPGTEFVSWCSDISAASSYVQDGFANHLLVDVASRPRIVHVAISEFRRDQLSFLLDLDRGAIRVIPPPVDPSVLLGLSPDTCAAIREFQLEDSSILIFVPAKLLPHKNLELALSLAGELRGHLPDIRMVISSAPSPHDNAASDAVRAQLEELRAELHLEREVHFLAQTVGGPPGPALVRDLMMLSDVVFLPSREEGYGIPIAEAATLRVPVVCSDIPAFREAGASGVTYFQLSEGVPRIAQTVCSIVEEPGNENRRQALRSLHRFRTQVVELAEAVKAAGSGAPR